MDRRSDVESAGEVHQLIACNCDKFTTLRGSAISVADFFRRGLSRQQHDLRGSNMDNGTLDAGYLLRLVGIFGIAIGVAWAAQTLGFGHETLGAKLVWVIAAASMSVPVPASSSPLLHRGWRADEVRASLIARLRAGGPCQRRLQQLHDFRGAEPGRFRATTFSVARPLDSRPLSLNDLSSENDGGWPTLSNSTGRARRGEQVTWPTGARRRSRRYSS